MLDPEMSDQELRLHMGEMTAQECRTARAAIRWANTRALESIDEHLSSKVVICSLATQNMKQLHSSMNYARQQLALAQSDATMYKNQLRLVQAKASRVKEQYRELKNLQPIAALMVSLLLSMRGKEDHDIKFVVARYNQWRDGFHALCGAQKNGTTTVECIHDKKRDPSKNI